MTLNGERLPLPERLRAVIFDLDGVLCHTDRLHFEAWDEVCREAGLSFDEEINHGLRGVSREESLEVILRANRRDLPEAEKSGLLIEKNRIYREKLEKMSPRDLPSGVRPTLLSLRAAGLQLGIGSSSKNARLILDRLRLTALFDVISDGVGLHAAKPDPEVFLRASAALGLSPRVCLVVEDAPAGIEAGRAGGFPTAGIGPAALCPGTDYPISDLEELIALVRPARSENGHYHAPGKSD